MPDREAVGALVVHGAGRERDDRDAQSRARAAAASLRTRPSPACGSPSARRRTAAARGRPAPRAVLGDHHAVAIALQHGDGDRGVDGIVFGEQDVEAGWRGAAPAGDRAGRTGAGSASGRSTSGSVSSNQNVLPTPGSLVDADLPPISSTSWRVMASPRPVPPKRRVIDPSACSKARNRRSSAAGSMPMPVSITSTRTAAEPSRDLAGGEAQRDAAALGELDGVAEQVDQHLAQPVRIAEQAAAAARAARSARSARPWRVAAGAHDGQRLFEHVGQLEGHALHAQLAGLDLREIEDVVDDVHQVLGRLVDDGRAFVLLGG